MNKKKGKIRITFLLAIMFMLALGQSSFGATITFDNGGADNLWSNTANWDLGRLPNADDDVVIDDALICNIDIDDEILSLTVGNGAGVSVLRPNAGDTVTLTINGNITMAAANDYMVSNNGTGRLNTIIAGASTITPAAAYVAATSGISFHNLTIQDAAANYVGDFSIQFTGDLTLAGTSTFIPALNTAGTATFLGGVQTTQTITVSDDSYCEFVNLSASTNADVETSDDITVTEQIISAATGSFVASAGIVRLTGATGAVVSPSNVGGGTMEFYDLFVANANALAPAGDFTIAGDFTKSGAGAFAATAGTVTFDNATTKEIIKSGAGALTFFDLAVASGANVTTNSTFNVAGTGGNSIEVLGTGSFIAETGTISVIGASTAIVNPSTGTLSFANLTLGDGADAITTASSFTITGNMVLNNAAATFVASAGTITFDNDLERTIDNSGGAAADLTFFNLTVADGSKVTTPADAARSTFTIDDGGAAGAGITILGNGQFNTGHIAGVLTFDGSATKTITNSSTGTLVLGQVSLLDAAGNDVTTASDFEVSGIAFGLVGAVNGSFAATAGTITMTDDCVITCVPASGIIFNNLTVDAAAVSVAAGDFVEFIGDLMVDGTGATFTPAATATCTFNGTAAQTIGGTSDDPTAIDFGILVLNKAGATDVLTLAIDAAVVNTGALTLTDGTLNLGSYTLTVGGTVTSGTGVIDGATGTYATAAGHTTAIFADALFTVNSVKTLYNLTLGLTEATDGDLTINGDLTLGAVFDISGDEVTLKGNCTGASTITVDATSNLILDGTGTCSTLEDALFTGGNATNITFKRAETLTGDLTVNNELTMNTGVQELYLSTNTLNLDGTVTIISGTILAPAGSTVDFDNGFATIPANMFSSNSVGNLTIAAAIALGSDLTILGTLTGAFNITTGDNILTFGPSSTKPAFTNTACVIGNMRQTVTNSSTLFQIGGGTAANYRPVTLVFANSGSSQVVTASVAVVNPTLDKGGDPTNVVDLLWTITPEGTAPNDSLKASFGWDATDDANCPAVTANNGFASKWLTANWDDSYFNNTASVGASGVIDLQLVQSSYPIMAADLAGEWAIFSADGNLDADKEEAISVTSNKVVITSITPNPVGSGLPFSATIQLQDQYGNPVAATVAHTISLAAYLGSGATGGGLIAIGNTSVVINGLSITAAGGESGIQLQVSSDQTGWQAGISEQISVIADPPADQIHSFVYTNVGTTQMDVAWTIPAGNAIVVARAGSAITDFPIDGTTYTGSSNFGAGSKIGDGVVISTGTTASVTLTGLAPNTTYYFRAFAYSGTAGNENYLTISAANNPKSQATSGTGYDDDALFGPNDTRLTAKPIGTNTPISGTIKSTTDEDWFAFSVTNASPYIRGKLTGVPANYNIELYDAAGRRIRRAMRPSTDSETFVINGLNPGMYSIRIYGVDGAFDATNPYTIQIGTNGSEYFSVTP